MSFLKPHLVFFSWNLVRFPSPPITIYKNINPKTPLFGLKVQTLYLEWLDSCGVYDRKSRFWSTHKPPTLFQGFVCHIWQDKEKYDRLCILPRFLLDIVLVSWKFWSSNISLCTTFGYNHCIYIYIVSRDYYQHIKLSIHLYTIIIQWERKTNHLYPLASKTSDSYFTIPASNKRENDSSFSL